MNTKAAIKEMLTSTQGIMKMFLSDLSDADLLVRPVPNANHIAWQLGHLISSEAGMVSIVPGFKAPSFPAGFKEQHSGPTASAEPPVGFLPKAAYLELFDKCRQSTIEALENLSDADLDKPTDGPMQKYAATLGHLFVLNANHTMMHGGQFSVVRRKLGKPIVF